MGVHSLLNPVFQLNTIKVLISIDINSPLDIVAEYVGDQRISQIKIDEFIFFDTETSGLSGGTGTFAFLIGAGRFEEDCFHLIQYFLRDPIEEAAQLHALSEFVGSKQGIVTFNGKTFDVPLLNSRYTINSDLSPFKTLAHIDLLPLARSLWRDRLPSRKLTELRATHPRVSTDPGGCSRMDGS